MTEATSGYLNREPRTESEAKSGRMVTLQLSVGELEAVFGALVSNAETIKHSIFTRGRDMGPAWTADAQILFNERAALRDRINTAIQEALNDD